MAATNWPTIDEAGFGPLARALSACIEQPCELVYAAGGMWVLQVSVGASRDRWGDPRRYVWISQVRDHDEVIVGFFETDDDGERTGESFAYLALTADQQDRTWAELPDFAEAVAQWAAELIVDFATGQKGPNR